MLNWELPQVPEPLRPLVYSLSRLIGDSQATMAALVNGRGDFSRAFELLNPTYVQAMTDKIRAEMQAYSAALREAGGRRTRQPAPTPKQQQPTEQTPAAPKPKRSGAKTKGQTAEPSQAEAPAGVSDKADPADVTNIDLFLEEEAKEPSSTESDAQTGQPGAEA